MLIKIHLLCYQSSFILIFYTRQDRELYIYIRTSLFGNQSQITPVAFQQYNHQ
jgi:hypothetical protein